MDANLQTPSLPGKAGGWEELPPQDPAAVNTFWHRLGRLPNNVDVRFRFIGSVPSVGVEPGMELDVRSLICGADNGAHSVCAVFATGNKVVVCQKHGRFDVLWPDGTNSTSYTFSAAYWQLVVRVQ